MRVDKDMKKLEHPIAIEEIRVLVKPDCVDKYIALDSEIWTPNLRQTEGFLGKEIWVSRDVPGEVTLIIYWEDYDQWQANDKSDWCKAMDERMFREMGEGNLISMEFKFKENQKFKYYELR